MISFMIAYSDTSIGKNWNGANHADIARSNGYNLQTEVYVLSYDLYLTDAPDLSSRIAIGDALLAFNASFLGVPENLFAGRACRPVLTGMLL